ncbi:MAG: Mrp/NBP35 family ATP-binding protein, partial [Bdellovibrionota bacterium]
MAENHDHHEHGPDCNHAPKTGIKTARNIIAIASGKGGVGKSTVTVNLAVALQATGANVGILDADIYGPSQPGMMGAKADAVESEGNLIVPTERFGVKMVSMGLLLGPDREDTPVIWRAPMAVKILNQFISGVAWGDLDYLLIDLPPGTGDVQLTLAQQASLSGAVIVTTPQQVALGIAKKGLRMFQQVNVPILGIVENMSGYTCGHCGELTDLFPSGGGETMAKELKVPFLGKVPMDSAILAAGDAGVPVVSRDPGGKPAQAFLVLARELQMKLLQFNKTGNAEPEKVELNGTGQLFIRWSDGHHGLHRPWTLRTRCA